MGLFDRFRRKGGEGRPEAETETETETASEAAPPDVVAVARRGMDTPTEDYLEQVLRADYPDGLGAATLRVSLSQPRWPASATLMESNVAAIARALSRQHGTDPQKSSYLESKGPDGADVLVVVLWR